MAEKAKVDQEYTDLIALFGRIDKKNPAPVDIEKLKQYLVKYPTLSYVGGDLVQQAQRNIIEDAFSTGTAVESIGRSLLQAATRSAWLGQSNTYRAVTDRKRCFMLVAALSVRVTLSVKHGKERHVNAWRVLGKEVERPPTALSESG